MHIDELRETLAEMAAEQPAPGAGAESAVARGRGRVLRRQLSVAVLVLAVVGVAAGFAVNRHDARRGVEVSPTPTPTPGLTPTTAKAPAPPPISTPVTTPGRTTQTRVTGASRIIFTSATEGWVCADPVLHTADGGHTWQAASWEQGAAATQPGFLSASATLTCAAVPTDAYMVVQSPSGAAFVVPVQGGSDPTGPVALPALPADAVVTQVDFVDRDHGWILASAAHGSTGQGLLYRTRTATGPFDPRLVSSAAPVGGIAFADAEQGWGIAGGKVERTTDGGATWHTVAVPSPAPFAPELGVVLDHVTVRGATIVIEGDNPSGSLSHTFFLVSADGGVTWTEHSGPPATIGTTETTMLEVIDADHWRFAFGSSMWVTDDGGSTWAARGLPPGSVSIAFTDARKGWAPDERGHVTATVDGGRTWYPVATATQPGYSGLAVVPTGCPAQSVTAPPRGEGATEAADAARTFLLQERGWIGERVDAVYPVDKPGGQFGVVFSTNVPQFCGAKVAALSYGVEAGNPSITQDSSRSTALVVAHFADGWKVWGFYR
jgi:photosystem II stability/assembly factor-like uncharacterized protein